MSDRGGPIFAEIGQRRHLCGALVLAFGSLGGLDNSDVHGSFDDKTGSKRRARELPSSNSALEVNERSERIGHFALLSGRGIWQHQLKLHVRSTYMRLHSDWLRGDAVY